MSISSSDIVWRQATVRDPSLASNGGRMLPASIPSAVKNNVWPDVPQDERIAGSTKHMKVFIHVANEDNLKLIRPRVFVETNTPGDDAVVFFPGTHTDTQAAVAPTRVYGGGKLDSNVLTGASVITVLTEGSALDYFKPGDIIRVSNKETVTAVTGVTHYYTIAGGGVSYTGAVATLTLTTPLTGDFLASNTRVSSVYETAELVGAVSLLSKTSAGGNYDNVASPIVVGSVGGIYDDWELVFTSGSVFTVTGAFAGMVGTYNTSSTAAPINGSLTSPYFIIDPAFWSGTWAVGDKLNFRTSPCALPIWYRRVIPAGASSLSGNRFIIGIDGESE